MDTISQREAIRVWLLNGRTLTPLQALEQFGCLRLAARINELRRELSIHSRVVTDSKGKRFAVYWL